MSNFNDAVNDFLSALSLGSGTHGITFDTIHHFLNQADNLDILKQLGKNLSILGIGLGLTEVLDHYTANNGNLSTNDKITLALAITSTVLLFASPTGLVVFGLGLFGAGFDIYKASN